MKTAESIKQKLVDTFTPTHLHIEDHSHLHAGHAQNTGTTETHFKIERLYQLLLMGLASLNGTS